MRFYISRNFKEWHENIVRLLNIFPSGFTYSTMLKRNMDGAEYWAVGLTQWKLSNWETKEYFRNNLIYGMSNLQKIKKEYPEADILNEIFIGGWLDNGEYYVDISILVYSEDLAIKIGKEYKQKGIFHLQTHQYQDLTN